MHSSIRPPCTHSLPPDILVRGKLSFREIKQVPPGSIDQLLRGKERFERQFWRPVRAPRIDNLDEAIGLLQSTIEAVVKSQMVSDVPLAVLQSGGIDSSLISLTLGRVGLKPPLFTAGFAEKSHDETDVARQIAASAGLVAQRHRRRERCRRRRPRSGRWCIISTASARIRARWDSIIWQVRFESIARSCCRRRRRRVLRRLRHLRRDADRRSDRSSSHPAQRGAGMVGRFAYRSVGANEARLPAAAQIARFALGPK